MRDVVGIDASFSGFAVAVASGGHVQIEEWKTQPAKDVVGRMKRYRQLVLGVTGIVRPMVEQQAWAAPLVVIEHYSFNSKNAGEMLGELGGILRSELVLGLGVEVVEVAPARLKKFATGRGNAGKPAVVSALSRRYDRDFSSDNRADAFGLAQLGMVLLGQADARTAFERDVALQVAKARRAAAA